MQKNEQSRNWLGTFNNPDCDAGEWLEALWKTGKCVYLVGQLEKGAEGTVHIQFFINFDKAQRLSFCRKLSAQCHWTSVKVNNGAHDYCMKEDTRLEGPWEFGQKPVQRNNKADWEEVRTLAKSNQLDKIPADIFIKHYHSLKTIAKDYMITPTRVKPRVSLWYWGSTGTGKSKMAFDHQEPVYPKMANKWWDGYQGQKIVVLDEFDHEHACLGGHLKKWSDPWVPFVAESKSSAVPPDYDLFIVTSNYSLEELFGEKPGIIGPLRRRFKVTHFNAPLGE